MARHALFLTLLFTPLMLISAIGAEKDAAASTNDQPTAKLVAAPHATVPSPEVKQAKALSEEKGLLKAQYDLRAEKLKSELADLILEKQRIDAELGLAQAQHKKAMAEQMAKADALALQVKTTENELKLALSALRSQKEKLSMEMALRAEQNKQATADASEEINRIKLAMEKKSIAQDQELQDLQARQKKLAAQNQLQAEENRAALAKLSAENDRLTMELTHAKKLQEEKVQALTSEIALLTLENSKAQQEQAARENEHTAAMTSMQHQLAEVQTAITLRNARDTYRSAVDRDVEYPAEPFKAGVLTISDRRIPLNDVIMEGTAEYITERIHYFNNQSTEAPIFIVIDRSPGGSVMEGYRIIKAMDASEAPIHVVVKSFAASMAATIATAAKHSYAYPNAIILHHQPSGFSWGNLTQQDEQLAMFKEWARRLHATVARKMGMTMDEFYAMMYEKNSDGNWQEFADRAQQLHWVDHIVTEIREEGIVKKPESTQPKPIWWFTMQNATPPDPKDNFVMLPRLKPFDFYFIYNPDSFYHWVQ